MTSSDESQKQHFLPESVTGRAWQVRRQSGPVIATAVHAGHAVSDDLLPLLNLDDQQRRQEEDPMTGYLAAVGDKAVVANRSRFEVDFNRSADNAVMLKPEQAWGLNVWRTPPSAAQQQRALSLRDRFYRQMQSLVEEALETEPAVLVLDIHSYNYRRDGADAPPADATANPDIDLGCTTLDSGRWGGLVDIFEKQLATVPVNGQVPDVRRNIRYDDGGYFPEWLCEIFDNRVCTMTIEYKKIYMDEWTGVVDLQALDALRAGLVAAVNAARKELS